MRWAVGISAFFLVVVTAIFVQFSSARNESGRKSSAQKFVVHEWGTFTSFSGSDGVKLEFRPLVENDLPSFVLDRGFQSQLQDPRSKLNMLVLMRMETPVTYFYTDVPREVSVKVRFPEGLLTEFYPPVEKMLPKYQGADSETMTDSELDWGKIQLIPEDHFQVDVPDPKLAADLKANMLRRMLPTVYQFNPYGEARKTDSAIVFKKTGYEQKLGADQVGFMEKFLFYRGVGNISLPLKLTAQSFDQFELTNHGDQPVRGLFLVTVKGHDVWFQQYSEISPHQTLKMKQTSHAGKIGELASAMEAALIETGLYPKEATAMVNTWRHSWFGEEGTRLLYLLPESQTEKILPLEVNPAPDEMLRVMVGRMEIMRPEDEELISAIVQESMLDRKKTQGDDPEPKTFVRNNALLRELPAELLKLGRLAEPALVRVKHINMDPDLQAEAELLIRELRWYRDQHANSGL